MPAAPVVGEGVWPETIVPFSVWPLRAATQPHGDFHHRLITVAVDLEAADVQRQDIVRGRARSRDRAEQMGVFKTLHDAPLDELGQDVRPLRAREIGVVGPAPPDRDPVGGEDRRRGRLLD